MVEKSITWFKAHLNKLKIVFLISVIIIVLFELSTIAKTISVEHLAIIFSKIKIGNILLMALIGSISVIPMIGYDLTLNTLLEQKPKKLYIFETSWLVNTLNNIAGFGGFISAGLRSEFYGKQIAGKKVVRALSKILVFTMSGLSIYALLSFFLVMFDDSNHYLRQYWIWLIGGGLYFPLIFCLSLFGKGEYLGDLKSSQRWQLIGTSFLEWSGVLISFISTGILMGISVDIREVIPLFIAATVIGIVSMIPGELGSFDLMMIIGLSALGTPKETVVAWLLLFRLFYYLVPFIIGLILFFKNLGTTINLRYKGIPISLLKELAHKLETFFLYFTGIMLVLSATIPEAFSQLSFLQRLNPIRSRVIVVFPAILLGFLLIVTGRGISARVKRAYIPTITLVTLTFVYSLLAGFRISTGIFLALLLLFVIFSKNELFREQLVYSAEWMTIDGLIMGGLGILYIIIGVYNSPKIHHRHHLPDFFLFPSEQIWIVGFVAILSVAFIILLLIHFFKNKRIEIGEPLDEMRVQHILQSFGGNPDSQLVFLKDKKVFYYNDGKEDTVFFQMATFNNKLLVMGDPSGKKADFEPAIEALIDEADRYNYLPVFYENSEEIVMILHEFGYDFIKFGERAHVHLPDFTLSGKKMKGQRATFNKILKAGYQFDVIHPPFSAETLASLKEISDEWLNGRKEKGFSLGFFSEDYLQRASIAIIKNETEIVAFANFMPTYSKTIGTIDLMRFSPTKAPSGTMDFLFINLFQYMRDELELDYFDLGMAPLANVGTSRKSFTQERIAYLVYNFGSRFYSFGGLKEYKDKYADKWFPEYVLYSRDSWIGYVMIALLITDNAPVQNTKNYHGLHRFIFRE
ncbi:bifunctional lysylphosphatidylglycerol flippase/synthetase MprF [Enterococcus dongliensis]|uniref:Bifunctional lysylphosphatidylglycerol flippase/synthetase MprF n=1 Tax=Enterococcus dongliensis TaxID=2559925 RepID=A0AAP5NL67_9ENTE|nr:bifunctional lysylphosphatidylglycerol flippase/synthetase MprF [Enterococcus dongliensis]MDT2596061.1 bifunctional lysylphosphatidylglycerol flippase/synthetase MprF [Enterococcus dongliensis]MDT2603503.1 bifunctional lysylphosphatidylglycerol flippase/synthetase MprF [Enterococcus dongliensis]MDT2635287.1 bifunctional lysylphosphatidylglycerol flippase/synthetase MprF [Enterococcus dongliensis]MDT2636915.1 bifunctional lysylphosphatidylglycerol flippase/synthetase MprF [Enterococcus dongli